MLACLVGAGAGRAQSQISPGPLARSHTSLEGALQCTKCHAWGNKSLMSNRCLACHEEIGWLLQQNRGYHARVREQRCAACHPDHAGSDFAMISWPGGAPARFDHAQAGWTLDGKHGTIACDKCHTTKFSVSPAAQKSKRSGTVGWVGLETRCAVCHSDVHRGALAANCATCHDSRAWKPAPRFDHAKSPYPLTGLHDTVACASCHVPPPGGVPVFKPVAHAECSDCHKDPHAGQFGAGCAGCHSTTGFRMVAQKNFSHERTKFPLRGRHVQVDCSGCHTFTRASMTTKPFARCDGCHADAHAGTATLAGQVVDCNACHDETGFHPSTFTVARHGAAKFALLGRHAQVACASCHPTRPPTAGIPGGATQLGTAGVQLHPVFGRCRDCHADGHDGQLAGRPDGGECAVCHRVAGWTPSVFSISDHALLKFPLEGAHRAVPCGECHRTTTTGKVGGRFVFALAASTCQDCHKTPHGDQFASDKGGDQCTRCHGVDAFRPATRFDHDRDTVFPLKGGHQTVPCSRCHLVTGTGASARIVYSGVSGRCENCHSDKSGVKPS